MQLNFYRYLQKLTMLFLGGDTAPAGPPGSASEYG
jgi:hypothetical protein